MRRYLTFRRNHLAFSIKKAPSGMVRSEAFTFPFRLPEGKSPTLFLTINISDNLAPNSYRFGLNICFYDSIFPHNNISPDLNFPFNFPVNMTTLFILQGTLKLCFLTYNTFSFELLLAARHSSLPPVICLIGIARSRGLQGFNLCYILRVRFTCLCCRPLDPAPQAPSGCHTVTSCLYRLRQGPFSLFSLLSESSYFSFLCHDALLEVGNHASQLLQFHVANLLLQVELVGLCP